MWQVQVQLSCCQYLFFMAIMIFEGVIRSKSMNFDLYSNHYQHFMLKIFKIRANITSYMLVFNLGLVNKIND